MERRRLKQNGKNRRQRRRGSVRSTGDFLDKNNENHSNNRNDEVGLIGSNSEEMPPIGCSVWLPTIGTIQTTKDSRNSTNASSSPSVVKLSSISNYWRFQSFRLPWWYANDDIIKDDDDTKKNCNDASSIIRNDKFPHVVVLGSTFWRNPNVLELAVDTASERAKITTLS